MMDLSFLKYGVLATVAGLLLSACDKSGDEVKLQSSGVDFTIAECEQYFARMRTCVNEHMSEDKQQINEGLKIIRDRMAQEDDQEKIRALCQRGLDRIEEDLKAMGCSG